MAGYLRTGPAGGRREPGSRGASLVFRACVSGGAGPWRASRDAAPRLLPDILGPGAEAGRAGASRLRVLAGCYSNCPHSMLFLKMMFTSFILKG